MTPAQEERNARTRLRSLAKARRERARKAALRARDEEKLRITFRAWLGRERAAFALQQADPAKRSVWIKVLRERPALYGRREAA